LPSVREGVEKWLRENQEKPDDKPGEAKKHGVGRKS